MSTLDRIAALAFVVSGALVLAFGMFSVIGTLMGGMVAISGVSMGGEEDAAVGVLIFAIYGAWMVACLLSGSLQIFGGAQLLRGRKGTVTWVATFAALLPMITVYCAMPSMIAFGLGLAALLVPEPTPQPPRPAPDRGPADRGEPRGPGDVFDPPR